MSFIPQNPITSTKLNTPPPSPPSGTRGIFPQDDGWYDITDNGDSKKLSFEDDLNYQVSRIETEINGLDSSIHSDINEMEASLNNSIDSLNSTVESAQSSISELETTKVDKIDGKGLSANDYTDEDKAKVATMLEATDVLTKNNTSAFTPTGSYQPATKKYVDDITNNFVAGTAFGGAYIGGEEMIETLPLLGVLFVTSK